MKTLKVTLDEIKELIEKTYKLDNIKFMRNSMGEGDFEICEDPDYIEGELRSNHEPA